MKEPGNMKEPVEVVAALIVKDGKFMICRRPPHKARGLLWEFVGGKIEKGETPEQALMRECREELDVDVSVGALFCAVTHSYPDLTVRLFVYRAAVAAGEPKMLEHVDIRYISPDEIDGFDFCPADKTVLEKIKAEFCE